MSQRGSGYARKENDCYETPEWVTEAVIPYLPKVDLIWEPAAGSGQIARVLQRNGFIVSPTDISRGVDFLEVDSHNPYRAIVTNPPYGLAQEFIEHSLELDSAYVAMLLRTDYDHAKTRAHLFEPGSGFRRKLVLRKRIIWFERPGAAPSFNHAWFIWERGYTGEPVISYGP